MGNERRRDYMVSTRVHSFYMITLVASLLMVCALAATIYALSISDEALSQVPELAGLNAFLVVGVLAFVIVCTALFLGVYTIVHTHHLLGSAYRIGVVLREINDGLPTRVKLRDGDFFLEIGDEINALADKAQGTAAAEPEAEPSEAEAPPSA